MKKLSLNVKEFQNYINDKKIICFGAGKHGRRMLDIMHNYEKLNDLVGFIDNSPEKWGKTFEYEGFSIPVFSIDEALNIINENFVIVITCLDFIKVTKQLEEYEELKNISCVSLIDVALQQLTVSDYPAVIKQYDEPVIPKKIHYCWFGKGEKPDLIKRNIEKWKKLCPDYEIIEWNESNYDVTKNEYMKQAYEKGIWGFVPDYARLDIIYNHGGIYLDTDVDMIKRPDDLLYQDCFSTFDCTLMMAAGAGLGARPGCEVIKEMRDYYDNISFFKADGTVDDTSCMMHTYAVLKKYDYKLNDTLQNVCGMNIYPMILQATCTSVCLMRVTEKTYFAHLHTGTWLPENIHKIREENIKNFRFTEGNGLIRYNMV
ncbi:MAG: hypothetical protein E7557_08160 [Ruminococcaceae bacterium]|nr:hypothetical protein [Oscillospiraceae bacterium]